MIPGQAVLFGLLAALSWGSADFFGGFLARRLHMFLVVFTIETVGILALIAAALWSYEPVARGPDVLFGTAAGIAGMIGILAMYRGMALYPMGLIAPSSAVITAAVPVAFGFSLEGLPESIQVIGLGLAFLAVWLISSGESGKTGFRETRWILLRYPLIAGIGFGLTFVFFDQVSQGAVYWPIIFSRGTSLLVVGTILLLRPKIRASGKADISRALLPVIFLGGILDAMGNVFFVLAAQAGRLDISSVLASFYPAGTVFLAWLFLKERLARKQLLGVLLAFLAVGIITTA